MKRREFIILNIIIFSGSLLLWCAYVYGVDSENPQADTSLEMGSLEYNSGNLKDPFEGPFDKQEKENISSEKPEDIKPPDLVVQGITWSENGNRAIINNKVVSAGDTLEGVKVTRIDKDGVVVVYKGRQHILEAPAKKMTGSVKNTEGGTK